ncbi:MAG: hypothetical protein PHD70_02975 [Anaerostipes sp.]|jgi:hypothetical protein|nr:hypothetical protein [Anaerostipes sp.]
MKHKIKCRYIVLGIFLILFAIFQVRYPQVNANGEDEVHIEKLSKGMQFEDAGVILSFEKVKKNRVYNKDYNCQVDCYEISYQAKNISNETFDLREKVESKIILVTAGEKWYVNQGRENILKPKEEKKGKVTIDVIIDPEMKKEVYEKYEIYSINREENGAFINQLEF